MILPLFAGKKTPFLPREGEHHDRRVSRAHMVHGHDVGTMQWDMFTPVYCQIGKQNPNEAENKSS
jgi:hypothetical protein